MRNVTIVKAYPLGSRRPREAARRSVSPFLPNGNVPCYCDSAFHANGHPAVSVRR